MNVKGLRNKLSKLDDETRVVVYWEEGKQRQYFEIEDAALAKGTPHRDANGKPGFIFDSKGPATWLFINVSAG
jgi:ribosomal protein L21E